MIYFFLFYPRKLFFRLGPVRNLKDFDITAEKDGYKFEKDQSGFFVPVKLSQLRIAIVDAVSGEPLNDVLLSLSGVQNYRSNNIIDKDGKITFVGLVRVINSYS